MLTPARGDRRQRLRQRPMLGNELIQDSDAVELLDRINIGIEHPSTARRTSWCSDHCVRPSSPPRANLRFIGRRVFEAMRRERLLVERAARENGKTFAHIFERVVERVARRAGLRLWAHGVLSFRCSNWLRQSFINSFKLSSKAPRCLKARFTLRVYR